MISIVCFGTGNIQSVHNAFEYLGHSVSIASTPADLRGADRIVIPGVGAFPKAMENLTRLGFAEELGELVIEKGKPVLGICLGMQLLAEEGTEFRTCRGLGWIAGRVEIIPRTDKALRLPQVGWNELESKRECPLLRGIEGEKSCYFVHSYQLCASEPDDIVATVDYGGPVTAAVARGNIFGMQFHPEKSQKVGLRILDNFARL